MSAQILPESVSEPDVVRCPMCGCSAMIDNWQPRTGPMQFFGRCYLMPTCAITGPERPTYEEARAAWNNWINIARLVLMPDLSGAGG